MCWTEHEITDVKRILQQLQANRIARILSAQPNSIVDADYQSALDDLRQKRQSRANRPTSRAASRSPCPKPRGRSRSRSKGRDAGSQTPNSIPLGFRPAQRQSPGIGSSLMAQGFAPRRAAPRCNGIQFGVACTEDAEEGLQGMCYSHYLALREGSW